MELDNNDYFTLYLLPEEQVQSEVNVTVEFFKNSASTRIISFLDYLKTITKSNYFVSALNTNIVVYIRKYQESYVSSTTPTLYCENITDGVSERECSLCGYENSVSATGFFSVANYSHYTRHVDWPIPELNSTLVNGFYGACTTFEALLHSTLDCLYDTECLELLIDYFPDLNQVYMT